MYVYTVWAQEDDDMKKVILDGGISEFGLDELVDAGDFSPEEVKKCILAEFPAGGDEDQPGFTVLTYVKIIDENDEVLAEIEY